MPVSTTKAAWCGSRRPGPRHCLSAAAISRPGRGGHILVWAIGEVECARRQRQLVRHGLVQEQTIIIGLKYCSPKK